ncbi:MAG: hypothetical protein H7X71_04700 [Chitinophagales bacterium]|nr:hypothetical protein [Chitinophagales bacterium]
MDPSTNTDSLIQPFGEVSFEIEETKLGALWETYFFEHTNFVDEALDPETYLIIGRRGSGKSTLCEYFSHQNKIKNSRCLHVGKAESYHLELFNVAKKLDCTSELATQKLAEIWEYSLWQLIFKELTKTNPEFKAMLETSTDNYKQNATPGNIFKLILKGVLNKHLMTTGSEVVDSFGTKKTGKKLQTYIDKALAIFKKNPIILIVDSREQYDKNNDPEMWIISALVQSASNFNVKYAGRGMHIKVCVADEIFPYLEETFITNTLKYIRNPLYLYWRPKDLVRLICWRYFKYLKIYNKINYTESQIDWDSFKDIYEKIWVPYFGEYIINRRGVKEKTLPYILRHTHLRPRQLIIICNRIAKIARQKKTFPVLKEEAIREGVLHAELELANELINSYKNIYPHGGDIISALEGMPMEFKGSELNKAAPRTASQWLPGEYNPYEFKKFLIELGVVGRKRDKTDDQSKIIQADFEFAMRGRVMVTEKDTCVIHPMFYSKLNINKTNPVDYCVYPFPEHPDFEVLKKL